METGIVQSLYVMILARCDIKLTNDQISQAPVYSQRPALVSFRDVCKSESEVSTIGRHEKDAHIKRLTANGNASIRPCLRLHSHVNRTIDCQTGVSAALAVTPSSGERL